MQKIILITALVLAVFNEAKADPTPTPAPTPIKGFIDPCKLQTMSEAHAAWKLEHCN